MTAPPPASGAQARSGPGTIKAYGREPGRRADADAIGETPVLDPNDVRLASRPPAVLAGFNQSGVLAAADVHGARTLCRLADDNRDEVLLAAALAIRAPQHGHVCVELPTVAATVTGSDDAPLAVDDLPWPDPTVWRAALEDSPLVTVRPSGTVRPDPESDRPLTLVGDRLYLDRYWRYERRVAEVLRARATRTVDDVDNAAVRAAIERLLPPGDERPDRQRLAVASGVLRDLTVIAGGPGTGKTYTVARLLALTYELQTTRRRRVAVAAPTGKAADRLTAALREAADEVPTTDEVRQRLRALEATTLHRLLGWRPGSHTRFRHDRNDKLPYEVVVVDETSMVDLPMMAKLLVALRRRAQLVVVGDPDQLASVEAGAVLADIVGPTGEQLRKSDAARHALAAATGEPLDLGAGPPDRGAGPPDRGAGPPDDPRAAQPPDDPRAAQPAAEVAPARPGGIDDAIVVLGTVRRYAADSGIARLAAEIHAGDANAAVAALRSGAPDIHWIDASAEAGDRDELAPVRTQVVGAFRTVLAAARAGDADAALHGLDRVRLLCAHRRGRVGAAGWAAHIERWVASDAALDTTDRWYVGRPVMITRNEPRLRLFNGDVGVVVASPDGPTVAFRGAQRVRGFAPTRLEDVESVHAMTIHKSQGSQFHHVVAILPDETSPILTRELLYTAVTRAQRGVTVVGTEASVRHGIVRRVARASGLRETLWGGGTEAVGRDQR